MNQRGFTLAELLVAIAIVGLIMAGLLTLLMQGNQSYLTGSNQVEAQAATRSALEQMTTDIREAGYDPAFCGCVGPGSPAQCPAPGPANPCFSAVTAANGSCTAPALPAATGFTLCNDWNGSGAIQPAPTTVAVPYTFGGVATNVNRGELITYNLVLAAGGAFDLTRQESAVDAQPQVLLTQAQRAVTGVDCAGVQIANPPIFQYCNNAVPPAAAVNPQDIRSIVVNLRVGVQSQPPGIWQAGAITVTMSDRIRLRNR